MVFNQPVKNKEEFMKIRDKILSRLGVYKHPKDLTASDKNWLKDNIAQYDESVLNNIINDSILPDKPKRTD